MSIVVSCKDLIKTYQQGLIEVHALADVDLEIERGDFICLSGPSGSGKSTLLNMIGGLDVPSSGEITIDDQRIDLMNKSELAEMRLHKIGFVFQAYNLIPVLSCTGKCRNGDADARAEKSRVVINWPVKYYRKWGCRVWSRGLQLSYPVVSNSE